MPYSQLKKLAALTAMLLTSAAAAEKSVTLKVYGMT